MITLVEAISGEAASTTALDIPIPLGIEENDILVVVLGIDISGVSPQDVLFAEDGTWDTETVSTSGGFDDRVQLTYGSRVASAGEARFTQVSIDLPLRVVWTVLVLRNAIPVKEPHASVLEYADETDFVDLTMATTAEDTYVVAACVKIQSSDPFEEISGLTFASELNSASWIAASLNYGGFDVRGGIRTPDELMTATYRLPSDGWLAGFLLAFAPLSLTHAFDDNYKAKLARSSLPTSFDRTLSSTIGKIVSIPATIDNEIGGFFGYEDPLPDEEP